MPAAVDNPTPMSIQPGRVPTPEVPAFTTETTAVPPSAKFLEVVLPPPCLVLHVLATSSMASHHLSLAFLVLQACTDLLPLELHKMSPSVGVSAVKPASPPPAFHVLPASCPPLLEASDASLEASEILCFAGLVLHALLVPRNASFASKSTLLLPEKELLPADGMHLLVVSQTLLVRFHPLGPAFLVALAGIELPPCSSTPLVVGTGVAAMAHAANETATTVLVCLPDEGAEPGRDLPVLPGNPRVSMSLAASSVGCPSVRNTPPKAPPLASFPCMVVGFPVSFPCSLAVCSGDLCMCLGPFSQVTMCNTLVAALCTTTTDTEAVRSARNTTTSALAENANGRHLIVP